MGSAIGIGADYLELLDSDIRNSYVCPKVQTMGMARQRSEIHFSAYLHSPSDFLRYLCLCGDYHLVCHIIDLRSKP